MVETNLSLDRNDDSKHRVTYTYEEGTEITLVVKSSTIEVYEDTEFQGLTFFGDLPELLS